MQTISDFISQLEKRGPIIFKTTTQELNNQGEFSSFRYFLKDADTIQCYVESNAGGSPIEKTPDGEYRLSKKANVVVRIISNGEMVIEGKCSPSLWDDTQLDVVSKDMSASYSGRKSYYQRLNGTWYIPDQKPDYCKNKEVSEDEARPYISKLIKPDELENIYRLLKEKIEFRCLSNPEESLNIGPEDNGYIPTIIEVTNWESEPKRPRGVGLSPEEMASSISDNDPFENKQEAIEELN